MFSLALPRPYKAHAPRLGFAIRNEPVFIITVATSWAGMSVCIDRITERLSTCAAMEGNTSLTSIPDFPYFANLNGDAIATPFSPGSDCPSYLVSAGLGSQVSTCEGAPWAKIWMTLFAFAGKCVFNAGPAAL